MQHERQPFGRGQRLEDDQEREEEDGEVSYQFQMAIVLRQNALFQVILLVAIFIYMLQPQVRAAFLHSNSENGKP